MSSALQTLSSESDEEVASCLKMIPSSCLMEEQVSADNLTSSSTAVTELFRIKAELKAELGRFEASWTNETFFESLDVCEESGERVKMLLQQYTHALSKGKENEAFDAGFEEVRVDNEDLQCHWNDTGVRVTIILRESDINYLLFFRFILCLSLLFQFLHFHCYRFSLSIFLSLYVSISLSH